MIKGLLWLALTTITLTTVPLFADDFTWNNIAGGDFGASENWNPAGPPGADDRAIFEIPLADTIFLYSDVTNDQLHVDLADTTQSTDVNLNLNNYTYTLHHDWTPGVDDDPAVVIGDGSEFTRLAVVHGVIDAYDCIIARQSASLGVLAMLGDDNPATDDRWTAFYHGMYIGDSGNGALWIDHGATVEHGHGGAGNAAGGSGYIAVQDTNSLWYCTGYFGLGVRSEGTLELREGGTARIGRCVIGELRDDSSGIYGRGYATIDGENSTWELLGESEVSLVIGDQGSGSVIVQNQGFLHNFGHVTIGQSQESYGELIAQSGGRIEIEKSLSLGRGDYVNGDIAAWVNIEGADTQLIINGRGAGNPDNPDPGDFVGLLVGKSTHSLLELINGGYVANQYITLVGGDATGNSEVVVDGMSAHLHNKYRLEIGNGSQGQLNIGNGGLVTVTTENDDPELAEGTKGIVEIGQNAPGYVYVGGHDSNEIPSSLIASAQIKVGVENYGAVEISGGGRVESHPGFSSTNSAVIIGTYDNGEGRLGEGIVTVTDAGSLWTHDGIMNVGFHGRGILEIYDGARVESGYGIVARYAGSVGRVVVSGPDAVWAIGDTLVIGGDAMSSGGTGEVTVSNYGKVELPGALEIWADGSLTIDPTAVVSADFIEMTGGTIAGSGTIVPEVLTTSLATIITPEVEDEIVFASDLFGVGDLVKEGPGTVTVKGIADYEGLTTITEGSLQFNGATATLHDIVGDGTLGVGTDGTPTLLTADSIRVNALLIGTFPDCAAVPEPSVLILLLTAVAVVLCRKRMK